MDFKRNECRGKNPCNFAVVWFLLVQKDWNGEISEIGIERGKRNKSKKIHWSEWDECVLFVAESLCRINCLSGRFFSFLEWAALHFSLTANKEGDRTIEVFAWKFSYSPNIGKNNIGIELGMEVEDVYWCKIHSRLIWSNGPTTTTTRYHMNKRANKQHGQSKPCLMVNCTFQLYTGSIQLHFSIHKTERERESDREREREKKSGQWSPSNGNATQKQQNITWIRN